jgi:carboxymethylenebutenolidase
VTELQRYLAEEIAEDHADGLVSRREALRRLGLLGLGGAAGASLLAGLLANEAKAGCASRPEPGRQAPVRRTPTSQRGRTVRSSFVDLGV